MVRYVKLRFFILLVLPVLFLACDNKSLVPDEASLKSRVGMRWESKINKDFEKVYRYYSPAYRKFYTPEDYGREVNTSGSVKWTSVKVLSLKLDGESAKARIKVNYTLALPDASINDEVGEISTELNERWVWNSGQWWYIKEKAGL